MDDYYSLDQLLAESQKIPCTFNVKIPNMGHLEGTHQRDILPHSPLELPFWLTSLLLVDDQDYLSVQMPKAFDSRVRNALSASAKSVNLRTLASGTGGTWIEDLGLRKVLYKTLKDRLEEIIDLAARLPTGHQDRSNRTNNNLNLETDEFLNGLDEWEKEILKVGQESTKKMKLWEASKSA
ncbi:uncharacterized protein MELLADRAFT_68412 [Melampsora larici-populina 98AG31]|uniref:DNA replication complex GINS protein PSF3 n=1 Tax=Melampsora larici-populina (strain 98AG31 / pathotype 3-4-7) TaxID=747676 RepID=F4S6Q5_MELLP|nr:uncharacterized protein MELLADRAFT_68412 [Melampsora larici-populina 98AG31]EGF99678.1 hypothetical protein MELLADRAFT_68412 [Melampsora larici-populina 98AG31]